MVKIIERIKTAVTNIGEKISTVFDNVVLRIENLLERYREYRKKLVRHREYLDCVLDSVCEYKPESVDIELIQRLHQQMENLGNEHIIDDMKKMTVSERQEYFENTLLPLVCKAMEVEPAFLGWFQDQRTCGYYCETKKGIALNSLMLSSDSDYMLRMMVNTVIHECKHARQWNAVTGRDKYGYTDNVIDVWKKNFDDYIQPEESDEGYFKQPVEWDANCFAEQVFSTDKQL